MNTLSLEQLKVLCQDWQEKLGLLHWTIGLRICKSGDMSSQNVQATNKISLTAESALISILDNSDYPDSPFEQDMEVSLVHELLHIPLTYFVKTKVNTLEDVLLEAFIERVAKLLVKQSRETKE